jgi:hypothetical protein
MPMGDVDIVLVGQTVDTRTRAERALSNTFLSVIAA